MSATEQLHRGKTLSGLSPDEFQQRLKSNVAVMERVTEALSEAVSENELEPWQFAEVEAGIGALCAYIYGTIPSVEFSPNAITPGRAS